MSSRKLERDILKGMTELLREEDSLTVELLDTMRSVVKGEVSLATFAQDEVLASSVDSVNVGVSTQVDSVLGLIVRYEKSVKRELNDILEGDEYKEIFRLCDNNLEMLADSLIILSSNFREYERFYAYLLDVLVLDKKDPGVLRQFREKIEAFVKKKFSVEVIESEIGKWISDLESFVENLNDTEKESLRTTEFEEFVFENAIESDQPSDEELELLTSLFQDEDLSSEEIIFLLNRTLSEDVLSLIKGLLSIGRGVYFWIWLLSNDLSAILTFRLNKNLLGFLNDHRDLWRAKFSILESLIITWPRSLLRPTDKRAVKKVKLADFEAKKIDFERFVAVLKQKELNDENSKKVVNLFRAGKINELEILLETEDPEVLTDGLICLDRYSGEIFVTLWKWINSLEVSVQKKVLALIIKLEAEEMAISAFNRYLDLFKVEVEGGIDNLLRVLNDFFSSWEERVKVYSLSSKAIDRSKREVVTPYFARRKARQIGEIERHREENFSIERALAEGDPTKLIDILDGLAERAASNLDLDLFLFLIKLNNDPRAQDYWSDLIRTNWIYEVNENQKGIVLLILEKYRKQGFVFLNLQVEKWLDNDKVLSFYEKTLLRNGKTEQFISFLFGREKEDMVELSTNEVFDEVCSGFKENLVQVYTVLWPLLKENDNYWPAIKDEIFVIDEQDEGLLLELEGFINDDPLSFKNFLLAYKETGSEGLKVLMDLSTVFGDDLDKMKFLRTKIEGIVKVQGLEVLDASKREVLSTTDVFVRFLLDREEELNSLSENDFENYILSCLGLSNLRSLSILEAIPFLGLDSSVYSESQMKPWGRSENWFAILREHFDEVESVLNDCATLDLRLELYDILVALHERGLLLHFLNIYQSYDVEYKDISDFLMNLAPVEKQSHTVEHRFSRWSTRKSTAVSSPIEITKGSVNRVFSISDDSVHLDRCALIFQEKEERGLIEYLELREEIESEEVLKVFEGFLLVAKSVEGYAEVFLGLYYKFGENIEALFFGGLLLENRCEKELNDFINIGEELLIEKNFLLTQRIYLEAGKVALFRKLWWLRKEKGNKAYARLAHNYIEISDKLNEDYFGHFIVHLALFDKYMDDENHDDLIFLKHQIDCLSPLMKGSRGIRMVPVLGKILEKMDRERFLVLEHVMNFGESEEVLSVAEQVCYSYDSDRFPSLLSVKRFGKKGLDIMTILLLVERNDKFQILKKALEIFEDDIDKYFVFARDLSRYPGMFRNFKVFLECADDYEGDEERRDLYYALTLKKNAGVRMESIYAKKHLHKNDNKTLAMFVQASLQGKEVLPVIIDLRSRLTGNLEYFYAFQDLLDRIPRRLRKFRRHIELIVRLAGGSLDTFKLILSFAETTKKNLRLVFKLLLDDLNLERDFVLLESVFEIVNNNKEYSTLLLTMKRNGYLKGSKSQILWYAKFLKDVKDSDPLGAEMVSMKNKVTRAEEHGDLGFAILENFGEDFKGFESAVDLITGLDLTEDRQDMLAKILVAMQPEWNIKYLELQTVPGFLEKVLDLHISLGELEKDFRYLLISFALGSLDVSRKEKLIGNLINVEVENLEEILALFVELDDMIIDGVEENNS